MGVFFFKSYISCLDGGFFFFFFLLLLFPPLSWEQPALVEKEIQVACDNGENHYQKIDPPG